MTGEMQCEMQRNQGPEKQFGKSKGDFLSDTLSDHIHTTDTLSCAALSLVSKSRHKWHSSHTLVSCKSFLVSIPLICFPHSTRDGTSQKCGTSETSKLFYLYC